MEKTVDKSTERFSERVNQSVQLKKWKALSREQQQYYFRKAHGFFLRHLYQTRKPMSDLQRRVLIEKVYALMLRNGIILPRGEVYRVMEKAIARWSTAFIQRRLNKTNQVATLESPGK